MFFKVLIWEILKIAWNLIWLVSGFIQMFSKIASNKLIRQTQSNSNLIFPTLDQIRHPQSWLLWLLWFKSLLQFFSALTWTNNTYMKIPMLFRKQQGTMSSKSQLFQSPDQRNQRVSTLLYMNCYKSVCLEYKKAKQLNKQLNQKKHAVPLTSAKQPYSTYTKPGHYLPYMDFLQIDQFPWIAIH